MNRESERETCCWRETCSLSRVACFLIASIHRTKWRFFDGFAELEMEKEKASDLKSSKGSVLGDLFYFIFAFGKVVVQGALLFRGVSP